MGDTVYYMPIKVEKQVFYKRGKCLIYMKHGELEGPH